MAESVNIDWSPVVRAVDRLGNELGSQISSVQSQVTSVDSRITSTRDELLSLKQEFLDFVDRNERQRALQLAETRLSTLKADLEREFGHYGVVRRTSIGILQAFDIGNVRNRTVHEVSEELELQTPRYWLAPALVTLAAWSKDDQDLAQKSLDAAFSRDSKKTSLFFALVLRRQARLEEATRWLRHYFVSLDPHSLTREFAVLLEAIAQDGFGPEGRQLVLDKLTEWRSILREEADIVAAQVHRWSGELTGKQGVVDDHTFGALSTVSPDWSQVKFGLEAASAHQNVLEKFTAVRDTFDVLSASVADRLDDLLEILVTEFDEEELPRRREVLYQQAIIDNDGDEARARLQAEVDIAGLDETIDALTLQTSTALRPDLFGVSVSTQKVSVAGSVDDAIQAVGQYSVAYRSAWPAQVTIDLDETHSTYAAAYGFGSWQTTTEVEQEVAESSLNAKWDEVLEKRIADYTFGSDKIRPQIGIGVAAAVFGLLFLLIPGTWVLGLIIILVGGGIVVGQVFSKKKKLDAALAELQASRDKAKAVSLDVYREASAEWVDASLVYEEEDAKESELLDLFKGWPRA